jgi:Carbohydrate binding domain/Cellulase (glycosyl hydrolase family 5)
MASRLDRTNQPAHRKAERKAARRRHRARSAAAARTTTPRRTLILVCGLLCLALGLPAAIAATGGFRGLTGHKQASPNGARNLVFNGDFEKGLLGWRTSQQKKQSLSTSPIAAAGQSAATLTRASKGKVLVNDATNSVLSTDSGRTYFVTAFVHARGSDLRGRVRVREVNGDKVLAKGVARFTATPSGWTRVELEYVAESDGTQLDLNVVSRGVKPGVSLLVDNISMYTQPTPAAGLPTETPAPPATSAPTATPKPPRKPSPTGEPLPTDKPTETVAPSPTVSPTALPTNPGGGCVSDPMGIPATGAYLGAAVNGTSDIAAREAQLGQTLALHRTYYNANQINNAVKNAKSDLALGRLPWISFKAPYSWPQMAAGAGDAWATQLADALKTVPGPVWMAVHHEPENDGDMADWTAMQARIAPIIHQRTNNVAYSIIYSGWNTFGGNSNTIATKWPGDENVDILAIDAYNDLGAVRSGRMGTKTLELRTYYEKMAAWAKDHGTKGWAIGETGQTRDASAVDPDWLDRAYLDMVKAGGSGLSYYDSSANSVADWTLDDPIKLARFKALMAESERVC